MLRQYLDSTASINKETKMMLTATAPAPAPVLAIETDAMSSISTNNVTTISGVLISCCLCGVLIEPNPCNTCAMCLASQSDVTRGISSEATLHQCRGCHRWHAGGNNGTTDVNAGKWVAADLESRELMSLCLSKVSGLSNNKKKQQNGGLRLVDAAWIWTEPHCMRLKVRLTVQREVQSGTVLQQSLVVTFVIRNMQCMDCQAVYRQGSWKSLVQVRQRVSHKRTFLYLEQLILKHGAHRGCLSIETFRDGMDFYFPDKQKAARFLSFLENVVPMKTKTSKKLIGTDDKSNVSNYKYTNFVEICPLCKDDLVYLPKKVATNLGNISRCVLVKNISNLIHFVDPLTGQTASMSSDVYWRSPFKPIVAAGRSRLTRFIVLGKEPILLDNSNKSKRQMSLRKANRVASLTIAKERDLGRNDMKLEQTTHFGYLFKAGDVCVGYDLSSDIQIVDEEAFDEKEKGNLPDAVIVRKLYGGAAQEAESSKKKRIWALQKLDVTEEDANKRQSKKERELNDIDEEDFMQEVEADKEMRGNMFLYKTELARKREEVDDSDLEEDDQQVKIDELLDGLILRDDLLVGSEAMCDEEEEGGYEDEYSSGRNVILMQGERASKDGIGYIGQDEARTIATKEVAMAVGSTFGKEFFAKDFKFS